MDMEVKKISVRKAKSLHCPVCGTRMKWNLCSDPRLPSRGGDLDTTQFLNCLNAQCNVRIMISDLAVTGVEKEFDRVYRIQKKFWEKQIAEDDKRRKEAGLEPRLRVKPRDEVEHPTCDKCGRVCCDHENQY